MRWALIAALGLFAGFALFDPARHVFFPRCPLHAMTGLHCPGCGSQRALHHLLRGEPLSALRHNALFVLGAPALAAGLALARGGPAEWRRLLRRRGAALLLAGACAAATFGVARNLPGGAAWLAPPEIGQEGAPRGLQRPGE